MRLVNDMRTTKRFGTALRVLLALVALAVGAACFGEPAPVLVIDYSLRPPDTTDMEIVTFEGRVVRAPPLAAAFYSVEVTGGSATVDVDADDFGLFTANVQLNPRTTNNLVVQARDNTGVLSEPRTWVVVHVEDVPGTAPADPTERTGSQ
jgi:hypothetical protein